VVTRLVDTVLQREHPASASVNTVVTPARAFGDWVMEPEVPNPAGDAFLAWPTRRAFVDDLLQVRVQIAGDVLPLAAWVEIEIRQGGNVLMTLTTTSPAPHGQIHRPLAAAVSLGTMTEAATAAAIHVETDGAAHWTLLATTVKLPVWPTADTDAGGMAVYQARVRIASHFVRYDVALPPLDVVRWWATPDSNLGIVRAQATNVVPMIDGENFFAKAENIIAGANAGHTLFVSSWSFFCLTSIIAGEHAVDNLSLSPVDLVNTVIYALVAAAGRGAHVHILLDYHNGFWAHDGVEALLALYPAESPNIAVRIAAHPYKVEVGVGPFKVSEQNGSYHEKYVCLTGNGDWQALIGGIDFEPDRQSPTRHGWKPSAYQYNQGLAQIATDYGADWGGKGTFTSDFVLWHDIGVWIDGQEAVQFLADDYTRRWNAATPSVRLPGNLPQLPQVAPNLATAIVQMVKTDLIAAAPINARAVANGEYAGTRNAWEAAVRQARQYIYMENQYLRDPKLRDSICARLQENSLLQVIIVVPFRAEETLHAAPPAFASVSMASFGLDYLRGDAAQRAALKANLKERMYHHGDWLQAQFITKLRATAAARVEIVSLAKVLDPLTRDKAEDIYPHSKIMIVDDTWAYIGSANANGRSLLRDGESGFVIHDRAIVTAFRDQLWNEHLQQHYTTRDIRNFLTHWHTLAPDAEAEVSDYTDADLGTVQAVKVGDPPAGQKYNGPGSWMKDVDVEV